MAAGKNKPEASDLMSSSITKNGFIFSYFVSLCKEVTGPWERGSLLASSCGRKDHTRTSDFSNWQLGTEFILVLHPPIWLDLSKTHVKRHVILFTIAWPSLLENLTRIQGSPCLSLWGWCLMSFGGSLTPSRTGKHVQCLGLAVNGWEVGWALLAGYKQITW